MLRLPRRERGIHYGEERVVGKGAAEKKLSLAKGTKYLLDIMFYSGILVTISLPFSLKYIGKYLEAWRNITFRQDHIRHSGRAGVIVDQ